MIKVQDLAYVRFAVPDLGAMKRFAADFGLILTARDGDTLYHRGTDPSPYCHVTELGEPRFRGLALEVASGDDLEAASRLDGASSVEKIKAPGGGRRVRLTDPDGFAIELIHGRERLPALPVPVSSGVNRGSDRRRLGSVHRPPVGPASVKRLGHLVLKVADFRRSRAWYQSNFGFLSSDEIYLGAPENVLSAFMRCDRGDEFTDHHTLALAQLGDPGFEHAAFEVEDIDALMAGHDQLQKGEYKHHAGVGRHILGSQIFDYWRDPWGHVVEHFADGDLLDASVAPKLNGAETALGVLWGHANSLA
jgi:catechol 2,3-dioxygenase-like lactoylglutathione lyase family enzyme